MGPFVKAKESYETTLTIYFKRELICAPPLCTVCQLAQMRHLGEGMITYTQHPDQPLNGGFLLTVCCIHIDHYEYTL